MCIRDRAYDVKLTNKAGASASLPELMDMDVNSAMEFCKDRKAVCQKPVSYTHLDVYKRQC